MFIQVTLSDSREIAALVLGLMDFYYSNNEWLIRTSAAKTDREDSIQCASVPRENS